MTHELNTDHFSYATKKLIAKQGTQVELIAVHDKVAIVSKDGDAFSCNVQIIDEIKVKK